VIEKQFCHQSATLSARDVLRASGLTGWDFETLVAEQVPPGRATALPRRVGRIPRTYLRPWLRRHPRLEHAIAVRLSRRRLG
jgi:hypothetical protein